MATVASTSSPGTRSAAPSSYPLSALIAHYLEQQPCPTSFSLLRLLVPAGLRSLKQVLTAHRDAHESASISQAVLDSVPREEELVRELHEALLARVPKCADYTEVDSTVTYDGCPLDTKLLSVLESVEGLAAKLLALRRVGELEQLRSLLLQVPTAAARLCAMRLESVCVHFAGEEEVHALEVEFAGLVGALCDEVRDESVFGEQSGLLSLSNVDSQRFRALMEVVRLVRADHSFYMEESCVALLQEEWFWQVCDVL
jgi:hypothetical protein